MTKNKQIARGLMRGQILPAPLQGDDLEERRKTRNRLKAQRKRQR